MSLTLQTNNNEVLCKLYYEAKYLYFQCFNDIRTSINNEFLYLKNTEIINKLLSSNDIKLYYNLKEQLEEFNILLPMDIQQLIISKTKFYKFIRYKLMVLNGLMDKRTYETKYNKLHTFKQDFFNFYSSKFNMEFNNYMEQYRNLEMKYYNLIKYCDVEYNNIENLTNEIKNYCLLLEYNDEIITKLRTKYKI